MSETIRATHHQARGFVQCFVVDSATGRVVKEYPRQSNLILNAGMDQVALTQWADLFTYCAAGTGTTPTADDSGVTTATQVASTVTLSGGAFTFTDTATDAGKVIKWDTGEEAQIVTVTNPTTVVVNNSTAVPAAQFTVYRTNQTQLATELQRTANYLAGAPNCQTTLVGNLYAMRRTYDFTMEVAPVVYSEIAVGWASGPNNIFSRILLGVPVAVSGGQQLRVTYELQLSLVPGAPIAKTANIGGWPVAPSLTTDGTEAIQLIGLSSVAASGATSQYDTAYSAGEPSATANLGVFLSTDGTPPSVFGSAVSRTAGEYATPTPETYVVGTYYLDKTAIFSVGIGNGTTWLSMGYGYNQPNLWFCWNQTTMVFVFNETQTKLNTHTLTLTWRFSWSRVLS